MRNTLSGNMHLELKKATEEYGEYGAYSLARCTMWHTAGGSVVIAIASDIFGESLVDLYAA